MRLNTSYNLAMPVAAVWTAVTDFEYFEAALRGRDVTLDRVDGADPIQWRAQFPLGGRILDAKAHVARMDAPHLLLLEGEGKGLTGTIEIKLDALDAAQTQVNVTVVLGARSIGAQALLQPLKLARGTMEQRLEKRVAGVCDAMVRRYEESTAPTSPAPAVHPDGEGA